MSKSKAKPAASRRKHLEPSRATVAEFFARDMLNDVRRGHRRGDYDAVLFGLALVTHDPFTVFDVNLFPTREHDALWRIRLQTLATLGELANKELQHHAASPPVPLTAEEQEIRRQIEREVNTPERDDATRRGKFAALDELHAVVTALKRLRGAPAVDSRRLPILVELLPLAHLVSDVMMSEASAAPPHLFSVPRKTTTRPAASKR